MQTLQLTKRELRPMFNELQEQLGGMVSCHQKEYVLSVDNDRAFGEVLGVIVNRNIHFLQYNLTFAEDTQIVQHAPNADPIYFLYCAEGQMSHSFSVNGKKRSLNQFQTGIFASDPTKDTALFFRKDTKVHLTCISVNTTTVGNDHDLNLLQDQLVATFVPSGDKQTFAYTGSYNLKISEQIRYLESIGQKGLVRHLLIKGIVHMILALEIQQHTEDIRNAELKPGSLTRDEMEQINELTEFIQNYPEVQYSLKYLSKKSTLSPAKLQEGFKLLHNRTVSDFIRNVRVETAENLIKTTDLNISEIVYTVGLTSRSYFSKIFKEKYNCSPKYYQDHQNSMAESA